MSATMRWDAQQRHDYTDVMVGQAANLGQLARSPEGSAVGYPQTRREFDRAPVLPSELRFLAPNYNELDVVLSPSDRSLWCYMQPKGPPSFTKGMLGELIALRKSVQDFFASNRANSEAIQYFVGASRIPGIYNLGGDLSFFLDCIRDGNREGLRRYAHDCVNVAYHMWTGFDLPIQTIALVQGDALGGGFEGALSFNVIIAERSAKFGLPEILFNLFPGMGASSFLSRKLNPVQAEKMILSGEIFSAQQLFDMGLIDVLCEDGEGEAAVRKYIAENARRHAVHHALSRIRRRVMPLTLEELKDVTDIWVETALQLSPMEQRRMQRLMIAQHRRLSEG
ncbi:MAG: echA8 2 [Microvirga sp.]|jgi:DSF synthase|nr:echA8 2 [Microvirga sp.]